MNAEGAITGGISRELLLTIERAAVAGWPALQAQDIDGWLARASFGGSVRANTVSALDYTGTDLDASIDRVVDFYRARDAVPSFTVTPVSAPQGLDGALARRGWRACGEHVTMARHIRPAAAAPGSIEVRCDATPTSEWLAVYLGGLSADRRAVAPSLVARVPEPRTFFSGVRAGKVIATGLSALDGELASVQCMATLPAARRTGAASAVLAAIETVAAAAGKSHLYLQTDLGNAAAISLYQRIGFTVAGRYHVRRLAG